MSASISLNNIPLADGPWKHLEVLGQGHFSVVHKVCRIETGNIYAMKFTDKSKYVEQMLSIVESLIPFIEFFSLPTKIGAQATRSVREKF